jgi:hypothetical protein
VVLLVQVLELVPELVPELVKELVPDLVPELVLVLVLDLNKDKDNAAKTQPTRTPMHPPLVRPSLPGTSPWPGMTPIVNWILGTNLYFCKIMKELIGSCEMASDGSINLLMSLSHTLIESIAVRACCELTAYDDGDFSDDPFTFKAVGSDLYVTLDKPSRDIFNSDERDKIEDLDDSIRSMKVSCSF